MNRQDFSARDMAQPGSCGFHPSSHHLGNDTTLKVETDYGTQTRMLPLLERICRGFESRDNQDARRISPQPLIGKIEAALRGRRAG
ncbi:MAG: hypothetical protein DMG11_06560 [Acidobacteria bacterium]|nr:MAG: hypothetical protein DMG11_06560 [Acidobacteriota bacterium]